MTSKLWGQTLNRFARSVYWKLRSVVALSYGLVHFGIFGKTPDIAYQSMIYLFCTTKGRFSDWVSSLISLKHPPISLVNTKGVLGDMSDRKNLAQIVGQIRNRGFVVFPSALPNEVIDRLHKFTRKTPGLARRMDEQNTSLYVGKKIYTGFGPAAVRYDYDPGDLLNNEDIQTLLADGSLLSIVQEYLQCLPIADVLSMWWHTNFDDKPNSEAAQFYHFDMDRFKWVKIFIYLTDVGEENGPHSFVEGSHKTGAIPTHILNKGYVRISDEEISRTYSLDLVHSFVAPRGTIIIEDTRGMHKGSHVRGDSRLILQMQFSNSLFGATYPKATISNIKSESFKRVLDSSPRIYGQYL